MSLHTKAGGTRVTRATIGNVTDPAAEPDPYVEVTEDLVQRGEFPGGSDAAARTDDDRVTLAFRAGQVVRQSALFAMLTPATIDSITPNTGLVAGGTAVTISGDGLDGVTAVTFGGTAATAVTVVDPRTVTCTTPAHVAGAVDVVVTDDDGAVTETGGFTYQ